MLCSAHFANFAAYKKKKLEFDNHFSVFVYQSAYPG